MSASTSVGERTQWSSCELEEHIEEVRIRNQELSRMLTDRPFDSHVLDAVSAPAGQGSGPAQELS